jgi:hypothetical protein
MRELKGKDRFTSDEIKKLEELIKLRIKTPASGQKSIRQKMRNIGFYGQDDWGIKDLQLADLHRLINNKTIEVIGASFIKTIQPTQTVNVTTENKPRKEYASAPNSSDLKAILESLKLNCFDPLVDSETKIDDKPGNYVLCLRKNSDLPKVSISPIWTNFNGLNVLYTGIAGGSLKTRDYRQHFKGNNAGRSTLRKSLGVLFGYKQIPRDKDPNTGKTKFNAFDEQELTEWMHSNLLMFFLPTTDFSGIEIKLIHHFNPPLNLKDNHNNVNADFRRLLSSSRTTKNP